MSPALLLAAAAAAAAERDPLPALRVERPLLAPRGWCLASVGIERQRQAETERYDVLSTSLRYGLLPRVELRAEAGLVARRVEEARGLGPSDPLIGARASLLRREAPSLSVAADLSWRAPYGAVSDGLRLGPGVGVLGAALLGARQLGPVRLDGRAALALRPEQRGGGPSGAPDAPDSASLGASALLQLGPLAPEGRLDAEWWSGQRYVEAGIGIGIQGSRGLALDLGVTGPIAGSVPQGPAGALEPRGLRSRLGVEVAL